MIMGVNCDGINQVIIEQLQDEVDKLQAVVNRLADPFYTWVKHSESNWSNLDIVQADINAMQAYAKQHATEK